MKNKKEEIKSKKTNLENSDEDFDESLINFLIENQDNKFENLGNEIEKDKITNLEQEISSDIDTDPEDNYNGKILSKKENYELLYNKYAKSINSEKRKVAQNLKKKIKVVLGEGNEKNLVYINDEPYSIEEKIKINNKDVIALQLNKTRVGFSYFCSFYDERFNRMCFQPFKDKKEVVDHYFSLHMNRLKNYVCLDKNCKKSYVFYKQMKGHLIKEHDILSNFDSHMEQITYYFETRCSVKSISKFEDSKFYRNKLIEAN